MVYLDTINLKGVVGEVIKVEGLVGDGMVD